jgi:tetratricopeptide (TPR) repeat protein
MIHVPARRFGRGSILGVTGLLVALALIQPDIFSGDETSGTRNLPRAPGAVQSRPAATPADAPATASPSAHQAPAPSPEVLATAQRLSERLEANPRDADAWIELGGLLMKAKDPTRGTEAFAAAVEADPTRADARAELGKALLFAGQLRLSRAELRRALAIDPNLAEVHLNLGITYSHAAPADIAAARAAWMRAAELAPGTEVARQAGEYLAAYAEPAPTPAVEPRS